MIRKFHAETDVAEILMYYVLSLFLQMAPGNRKRANATPSTSARATGPGDSSASTGESSTVKGRGRTRGLGLAKYVKAHGRIRIQISDDGRTQVGQHNSAFNTAIGATARYEAPQNYVSWRKIPWETKMNQLFPSLLVSFQYCLLFNIFILYLFLLEFSCGNGLTSI